MTPRFAVVAFVIGIGYPAASFAKEPRTKKAATLAKSTAMQVARFILANGVDKTIKAPMSRSLGYDSDVVSTKAMRQTRDAAQDKREHAFYAIGIVDEKGQSTVKEFIISNTLLTESEGRKYVDGVDARVRADGKLTNLVHTSGAVGKASQDRLDVDSASAQKLYHDELKYQLDHIDYPSLKK